MEFQRPQYFVVLKLNILNFLTRGQRYSEMEDDRVNVLLRCVVSPCSGNYKEEERRNRLIHWTSGRLIHLAERLRRRATGRDCQLPNYEDALHPIPSRPTYKTVCDDRIALSSPRVTNK